MAERAVTYFLSFTNVLLACIICPQLWPVAGVVALGAAIMIMWNNHEVRFNVLIGIGSLAMICAWGWLIMVNMAWLFCYFEPDNKRACRDAAYAYGSNIALLVVIAAIVSYWLARD